MGAKLNACLIFQTDFSIEPGERQPVRMLQRRGAAAPDFKREFPEITTFHLR